MAAVDGRQPLTGCQGRQGRPLAHGSSRAEPGVRPASRSRVAACCGLPGFDRASFPASSTSVRVESATATPPARADRAPNRVDSHRNDPVGHLHDVAQVRHRQRPIRGRADRALSAGWVGNNGDCVRAGCACGLPGSPRALVRAAPKLRTLLTSTALGRADQSGLR